MRKLCAIVVLFIAGFAVAVCIHAQNEPDLKRTMVRGSIFGEWECNQDDRKLISEAKSSGLLNSESLPTQTCQAVVLSWLPDAQIVQLTGVELRDVFVCLTLIRLDKQSPIEIVRALGGGVKKVETENAKANKATFNELLKRLDDQPDDSQMLRLATLYLYIVGHPQGWFPKTMEEAIRSDGAGDVRRKNNQVIVRVNRLTARYGIPAESWEVRFRSTGKGLRLLSAVPNPDYYY